MTAIAPAKRQRCAEGRFIKKLKGSPLLFLPCHCQSCQIQLTLPSLPSPQVTMLIRTLHGCTTNASHCRLRKGPIQSRRKLTIFLFCGRPVTRNATTQGVSLLHAEREGKERGLYHTTDIENAINGSRVTSFLLLFITQNGSEHDRNL